MINSKTIVSVLTLSALAASAPTLSSNFSINLVPINVPRVHPAAKYARAHTKYGVDIPDYLALAARSGNPGNNGQADSVATNSIQHDTVYLSPIRVGNNEVLLVIDSASGDLWVKTRNTPGAGPRTYDPRTGTPLPYYYWNVQYSDGSRVGGKVYKDRVQVGNVTCLNQAVGVADYLSSPQVVFRNVLDGVMGVAFSSMNKVKPVRQNTFYENVKTSLRIPVFAAYLKHQAPGAFDFGWIDSNKYTGEITYTGVDPTNGYWTITCDGFSIGDTISVLHSFHAIVDTGTTLVILEELVVRTYYFQIRSAYFDFSFGGWVFDCNETPPSFTIKIGPHNGVIPGEYINYENLGSVCYGGIQPSSRPNHNILGVMFLKSQYVIFDDGISGHPRIGFATQA
ncbi:hypothetical protein TMatcc_007612 [Talaromyces marneffei ATCC 18224]|uniref:Aspergillopepsin F, putative n=2 Tax=Talaromyces marneffei TaxID=37727 RepID=B6QGC4_TALMQ|nr:aspergillopepsin F precursor, putative [Talaromyces marneffei ATCC 18224]KAE8552986.1 hypothetical protein EYB25_004365 [Talaromyces marneffei]